MPLHFNINLDYCLENHRVLLRPLQESDIEYLLPFAIETNIWQYSPKLIFDHNSLKTYLMQSIEARVLKKGYPFIVFDKKYNAFAGTTRFYRFQPINSNIEIGYTWYGNKFHGTGLNKHCKFLLLRFAFETVNAKRIEFRADSRNIRSIEALKSIGCVSEGVLRSQLPLPGGYRRDTVIFSILRSEWSEFLKSEMSQKLLIADSK